MIRYLIEWMTYDVSEKYKELKVPALILIISTRGFLLCWLKNMFSSFCYYQLRLGLNEPACRQAGKVQQKNITSTSACLPAGKFFNRLPPLLT
jgi:hypothetical protein